LYRKVVCGRIALVLQEVCDSNRSPLSRFRLCEGGEVERASMHYSIDDILRVACYGSVIRDRSACKRLWRKHRRLELVSP
jgi:hypothetical protein